MEYKTNHLKHKFPIFERGTGLVLEHLVFSPLRMLEANIHLVNQIRQVKKCIPLIGALVLMILSAVPPTLRCMILAVSTPTHVPVARRQAKGSWIPKSRLLTEAYPARNCSSSNSNRMQ